MLKPILLVEDDLKDIELTLYALEQARLANQVVILRDGAEALDYLYRRHDFAERTPGNPSVVLLDLKLPKIDGLRVLQAIRSDEQLQNIPVTMLSASNEERDVRSAYELGVNSYVVKPLNFQQFVNAVTELGVFWAILNEPPPGSSRPAFSAKHRSVPD